MYLIQKLFIFIYLVEAELDRRVIPQNSLSDSEDEGIGGRRNHHSHRDSSDRGSGTENGSVKPSSLSRRSYNHSTNPTNTTTNNNSTTTNNVNTNSNNNNNAGGIQRVRRRKEGRGGDGNGNGGGIDDVSRIGGGDENIGVEKSLQEQEGVVVEKEKENQSMDIDDIHPSHPSMEIIKTIPETTIPTTTMPSNEEKSQMDDVTVKVEDKKSGKIQYGIMDSDKEKLKNNVEKNNETTTQSHHHHPGTFSLSSFSEGVKGEEEGMEESQQSISEMEDIEQTKEA